MRFVFCDTGGFFKDAAPIFDDFVALAGELGLTADDE